jgi:triphosphoribosyl-dephospho-CoA synthase
MIATSQLSDLYQQACEIELQAFKAGNVSVYADGHEMTVDTFRLSASVSAPAITNPAYTLGEKIYYAVKMTREAVGCNTNLGIILLCAPMIQTLSQMTSADDFRTSLGSLLTSTTVNDAEWVFKAIALASPGGLGESESADVRSVAKITLTEAMKIAQNKDRIALQYTTNFKDIFDFSLLRYNDAFQRWRDLNWSAVVAYTALLSHYPDSHIERKHGKQYTAWVQAEMLKINDLLSTTDHPQKYEAHIFKVDQAFKKSGINPGTTADLTVATLFVFLAQKMLVQ